MYKNLIAIFLLVLTTSLYSVVWAEGYTTAKLASDVYILEASAASSTMLLKDCADLTDVSFRQTCRNDTSVQRISHI
jgi:hypothetical protein